MVCSLFEHEVISTTETKAREVRRTAESMITFAKRGDLHARRRVLRLIPNKRVVGKLFSELGPRYSARSGGYTRIVKVGPRRGDGANMCILELVGRAGAGEEAEVKAAASRRPEDEAVDADERAEDEVATDTDASDEAKTKDRD